MGLAVQTLVDEVVSHGLTTGYFDRVNTHEPKNAPGNGISMSVWFDTFELLKSSGLNSSSVRIVLNIRVSSGMLQEPQDQVDPNLALAFDALMTEYNGDFELGASVRMVDLLGAYGNPLSAMAGYVEQDKKIYRLFDIKLPLVVNDVWTQSA